MACECCGLNTVKCKSSLQGKTVKHFPTVCQEAFQIQIQIYFIHMGEYQTLTQRRNTGGRRTTHPCASKRCACVHPHRDICIGLHTDQQAEASGERSPNFTHHFLHEHRRQLPAASLKRRYKHPSIPPNQPFDAHVSVQAQVFIKLQNYKGTQKVSRFFFIFQFV